LENGGKLRDNLRKKTQQVKSQDIAPTSRKRGALKKKSRTSLFQKKKRALCDAGAGTRGEIYRQGENLSPIHEGKKQGGITFNEYTGEILLLKKEKSAPRKEKSWFSKKAEKKGLNLRGSEKVTRRHPEENRKKEKTKNEGEDPNPTMRSPSLRKPKNKKRPDGNIGRKTKIGAHYRARGGGVYIGRGGVQQKESTLN